MGPVLAELNNRLLPEFIEPKNWPPYSPDLNLMDYPVWGVATDGVSSQNFKH